MSARTRAIVAAALAIAAVVALVVAFTGESAPALHLERPARDPAVVGAPGPATRRRRGRRAASAARARPELRRRRHLLPRAGRGAVLAVPQPRHAAHRRVHPEGARRGGDARDVAPDFTYETRSSHRPQPDDGSVDVWLVGGGDPVLAHGDYAAFLQTQGETTRRRHDEPRDARRRHRGHGRAAGSPAGSSPTTPATTPSAIVPSGSASRTTRAATSARSAP